MPDRLCVSYLLRVVWLRAEAVSFASVLTVKIHPTLFLHYQYAIHLKVFTV